MNLMLPKIAAGLLLHALVLVSTTLAQSGLYLAQGLLAGEVSSTSVPVFVTVMGRSIGAPGGPLTLGTVGEAWRPWRGTAIAVTVVEAWVLQYRDVASARTTNQPLL